jgi:hypothetical protein
MVRTRRALACVAILATVGLPLAMAQAEKKAEIKGGVESTIKSVDADKGTVTVTTSDGRQRTLAITDETTIVGPRGGIVRRRLNDPRFHPGLSVTVVAAGTTVTELHLGYDRKEKESEDTPAATKASTTSKASPGPAGQPDETNVKTAPKTAAKAAAKDEDEDHDEEEFPGKVKSADPTRRVLVVTLLNGKDRSFLLAKSVEVTVKGTRSKQGLDDPSLKAGMPVIVVTEPGGHKVKEVQVAPASKAKKAG